MIRVVYIFLVYIISATSVYAEKKTTDAENLEFSKSCFNQTKNFLQPKFKEGMNNLLDLKEYNKIYPEYFKDPQPTRSTIVNVLPTFLKFELDCIAYAPKTRQEAD